VNVRQILAGVIVAGLFGCTSSEPGGRNESSGLAPGAGARVSVAQAPPSVRRTGSILGGGKIKYVVIIFQENRSTDNLFNGLKGANTVSEGENSAGDEIPLQSIPLTAPYDLDHSHPGFEIEYNGGAMNGFNLDVSSCRAGQRLCGGAKALRAYAYVPQKEVEPYFTMAEEYAFGDEMFATQAGPSFPAHQYILSGTATIAQGSTLKASENPLDPKQQFTGGCDSPAGTLVTVIDTYGTEDQQVFPCFDRPSLPELLAAKSLTWRYYQASPGPGLWNGPDAIKNIRYGSQYSTHVITPPSQVLTDVKNGNLATVVWVTPTALESDHAGVTNGSGPDWVASVVNAVGESKYWDNTAIVVTWDDWGGWYDHVAPQQYNSFELGFRVPLIVISPYAKTAYVSHVQHEFGSILKFVEQVFSLGSLGTTDGRSDNLSDCFNFSQSPRAFKPIPTVLGPNYFLHEPNSNVSPDDDF